MIEFIQRKRRSETGHLSVRILPCFLVLRLQNIYQFITARMKFKYVDFEVNRVAKNGDDGSGWW